MLLSGYFFGRVAWPAAVDLLRRAIWALVSLVAVVVIVPFLLFAICDQLFAFCKNGERSAEAGAIWPLCGVLLMSLLILKLSAVGL